MKFLMDTSGIPKNRQLPTVLHAPKCDYEAFCRLAEIKDNIVEYVQQGRSFYITSETTGNGKTSWAIKLLTKYFDCVWAGNGFNPRGLFIHVPTFLLKCKDFSHKDEAFEEMKRLISDVDIVVWDDIASTSVSAFDYSQLLMYMDVRASNDKCNIYTGNIVDRETLQTALGSKLTSRIWADSTEIIHFKGGDMR
jgi:DNA replication protein DnaC